MKNSTGCLTLARRIVPLVWGLSMCALLLSSCSSRPLRNASYGTGPQRFQIAFPSSLGHPIVRHEGTSTLVELSSQDGPRSIVLSVSSAPISTYLRHEQGQPPRLIKRLRAASGLRGVALRKWKQSSCHSSSGGGVPLPPGGSSSTSDRRMCFATLMAVSHSDVWFVDAAYPPSKRGLATSFLASFRAIPGG